MSRFKRVFGLGLIAGLLAALALAVPASAKTDAVCVVSGEAKVQDKHDSTLGVRVVGGKGSFTFTGLVIACVGSSKGTPDAQILGAEASGVFVNVVCGTGKAWGSVTALFGPAKYRNIILGKKFAIHFQAFSGTFFWHKTKMPKGPDIKDDVLDNVTKLNDPETKPKDDKNWHPAGTIILSAPTSKPPPPPPPNPNNCTKAFTATGVVVISEK